MGDPFFITGPALISFSDGRTPRCEMELLADVLEHIIVRVEQP